MKNQFKFTLVLLFAVFFNSCGQNNENIQQVKPEAFNEMLNDGENVFLLDVRTKEEYNSGALENAVNIDFYAADFSEQLSKLDKDKTYLVYCRSGNRSGKAANILVEKEFKNVVHLDGGITSWVDEGFPVVNPAE